MELALHNTEFDSFDELVAVVRAFPWMEKLSLRAVYFPTANDTVSPSALSKRLPKSLKSFTLTTWLETNFEYLCWLQGSGYSNCIESLSIVGFDYSHTKAFGTLLAHLGSQLLHLAFNIEPFWDEDGDILPGENKL